MTEEEKTFYQHTGEALHPKREPDERIRKRIDELLAEKRFDEAAILAVRQAFVLIDPEELTKFLLDAVKKFKEEKKNAAVQT